jgi:hypothetical protein
MLKAFTTINLFTLPIYFKFGGYLFAPAALIFCCSLCGFAGFRLISAAQFVKIYDYADLV